MHIILTLFERWVDVRGKVALHTFDITNFKKFGVLLLGIDFGIGTINLKNGKSMGKTGCSKADCLFCIGNSFSSNFNNLHSKLTEFPGLVKNVCSIDLYKPWTFEAYVKIASVWLRDQKSKVRGQICLIYHRSKCRG